MGRRATSVLVGVIALLALGGCSGDKPDAGGEPDSDVLRTDAGPLPAPPSPDPVIVAEAVVPLVEVFAQPATSSASTHTVPSPQPSGAPSVFVVLQRRTEMAEVLLPVRPAGSSGWVRLSDVKLSQHRWRIVVELSAYRLTVFLGPDVVRVETIGIGTSGTPTPGGRWFTTELLQPPRPDGPYGLYAFGLSGFTGGEGAPAGANGQLGLHGTNDPSTLGRNVSLGCLRMSNEAISALATQMPLGVPLDVRP